MIDYIFEVFAVHQRSRWYSLMTGVLQMSTTQLALIHDEDSSHILQVCLVIYCHIINAQQKQAGPIPIHIQDYHKILHLKYI
jgi:hypothetical protein